jgi:hypothetical protein
LICHGKALVIKEKKKPVRGEKKRKKKTPFTSFMSEATRLNFDSFPLADRQQNREELVDGL